VGVNAGGALKLPFSPHPNLGATASAQGPLGPCPRQGEGAKLLSSSFIPTLIHQKLRALSARLKIPLRMADNTVQGWA
jgi:hypothetical protein